MKLVSLFSTVKMMHGPINIRFLGIKRIRERLNREVVNDA